MARVGTDTAHVPTGLACGWWCTSSQHAALSPLHGILTNWWIRLWLPSFVANVRGEREAEIARNKLSSVNLSVLPFSFCRVYDIENDALVGTHASKINTISFSTTYRCMATGGADGYIVIWDLDGQQLHAIHLEVEEACCVLVYTFSSPLGATYLFYDCLGQNHNMTNSTTNEIHLASRV